VKIINKFDIILFDLDGVFFKPWKFKEYLEKHHNLFIEDTKEFFHYKFTLCTEGKADFIEEFKPFIKKWKLPYTMYELINIWFKLDGEIIRGTGNYIKYLKSKRIKYGFASTQEKYRMKYIEKNHSIINECNFKFFSCDIGYAKPHDTFFNKVSEKLGTRNILFIDDSKRNVEAAIRNGWNAIHFQENKTNLMGLNL